MIVLIGDGPRSASASENALCLGTFSNLEYNDYAGDLLGMEIKVVQADGQLTGALQIAMGSPGPLHTVNVTCDGRALSFDLPPSADGNAGKFTGEVSEWNLKGTVTFSNHASSFEILRRGRGYWDYVPK